MIPVRGVSGARVAVLGLGRSGRATARALIAGGAEALCWDDSAEARAAAEADGLTVHDVSRRDAWEGVSALIVSPGIPHLYPEPNKWIARAMASRVRCGIASHFGASTLHMRLNTRAAPSLSPDAMAAVKLAARAS